MQSYEAYLRSIDKPGIYVIWGDRGTRYIGSAKKSVLARWRKHESDLRRNVHHNTLLQTAYNDGERFKVYLHEYHADSAPLCFLDNQESHWVETFSDCAVNIPNSVHRATKEGR